MQKTKWDILKEDALKACKNRGHKMNKFGFAVHAAGQGIYGGSYCLRCGKAVQIDTNPAPNGIEIGGEAVALNCG